MNQRRSEVVSLGHHTIGRINETDRGFECFGADDRYMHTEPTLAGARKAIFQRHKDEQGAASA